MASNSVFHINPTLKLAKVDQCVYLYTQQYHVQARTPAWTRACDFLQQCLQSGRASFTQDDFVAAVSADDFSQVPDAHYTLEAVKQRNFIAEDEYARFHKLPGDAMTCREQPIPSWTNALERVGLIGSEVDIVVTPNYFDDTLNLINKSMHRDGKTWLPVCFSGPKLIVGPVFGHDELCYACIRERLVDCEFPVRHHDVAKQLYERAEEIIGAPEDFTGYIWHGIPVSIDENATLHAAQVAAELVHEYQKGSGIFNNRIVRIDPGSGERSEHPASPYPQCRVCGDPDLAWPGMPNFRDSITTENTWRYWDADRAAQALSHHCDGFSGLVVDDAPARAPTDGVYTVNVRHPFFVSIWDKSQPLFIADQRIYYYGSGQGESEEEAKAWAICEAAERMCAAMPFLPPSKRDVLQRDSYIGMESRFQGNVIHPNSIDLFSQAQLTSEVQEDSEYDQPTSFSDQQIIHWARAFKLDDSQESLVSADEAYLPLQKVRAGIGFPGSTDITRDTRLLWTSNGSAAGATLSEACMCGLLELIERDCVGMWWFNRVQRPQLVVDPRAHGEYYRTKAEVNALGYDLWVLDITNDLNIPVYAAIIAPQDGSAGIAFGFSAHIDPAIALDETVKEALQTFSAMLEFQSEDGMRAPQRVVKWMQEATLLTESYLKPLPGVTSHMGTTPGDLNGCESGIRHIVRQLNGAGIDAYCVDISRPDIPVKVVHTFAPGIRTMWKRFAPGRLYDVPVKLGWIDQANSEAELNHFSVWF